MSAAAAQCLLLVLAVVSVVAQLWDKRNSATYTPLSDYSTRRPWSPYGSNKPYTAHPAPGRPVGHPGPVHHEEDVSPSTLRLLHVVFRHGERTPADTYPNDPYIDYDLAPVGWGQLTNRGKRQLYEQGKWMRRRYNRFLGDWYHPDVVHVQSTDVDRTKMSAMLTMAGMWPPSAEQQWSDEMPNWQPAAIDSQPLNQDNLLLVRVPCGRYDEELERVMETPEVQALLEQWAPLMEKLSKITGQKIATPDDVQSLYSTLKAEEGFNLTLPQWTRSFYPDEMEDITAMSFVINAMTRDLQKIKGGPLIKEILEHSMQKAQGVLKPKNRKLFVYAGHDSTISNVLMALQTWDLQIPTYGILILFEVHEDPKSHEFGLKVFLRNSTEAEPYPLTIPDCGHFCPLRQLVKLTQEIIPTNLEQDCKPHDPMYKPRPPSGP